jgi:hypothetical protein
MLEMLPWASTTRTHNRPYYLLSTSYASQSSSFPYFVRCFSRQSRDITSPREMPSPQAWEYAIVTYH